MATKGGNGNSPDPDRGRTKKIAGEQAPIVRVADVLHPVVVRLALRAVPPHVRQVAAALEGSVLRAANTTVP